MATAAETAVNHDVRATIMYAAPMTGRARLDVVDPSRTVLALEPHEVAIRDARGLRPAHTLAANGFVFARHASSVADDPALFAAADNAGQVGQNGLLATYSDEMAQWLRGILGTERVVAQVGSFIARTSKRAARPTWAGTADMAHLDYTEEAARRFLVWNAELTGEALRPCRHYEFIQTWRAVSPGPQDNTLAICDGASVLPEDGVEVDAALGPEGLPGKNFPFRICRHRPGHEWFYLSDMTPEDVLLFKGFDSRQPLAMNAMHSAFDNPAAGPDAAPRRSIEARFIAFYD